MDSFWQQHRTFVLKIAAGLGVCIVFWIIGASMTDRSLDQRDRENRSRMAQIKNKPHASPEDRQAYEDALETLRSRIHFLAEKVGETRKGAALRQELIRDVLRRIDRDTDENRNRLLEESRGNPQSCFGRLVGLASNFLVTEAGRRNVVLDETLGFERLDMKEGELDRYLLTLDTIVRVVKLAIDVEVLEVQNIGVRNPTGGKFETESAFIREYPITVQLRGRSPAVLAWLAHLSDSDNFVPLAELHRLGRKGSGDRDPDVVSAEVEILALRIDPEGELSERLP